MDRVRLGRALGYGAHHAVKAMVSAADAATSPAPAGTTAPPKPVPTPPPALARPRVAAAKTQAAARTSALGKSVLSPVKKFSSVVWLQVTGSFFALFAASMGGAVWHHRLDFRLGLGNVEAQKAFSFAGLFLLFLWFAVSNFVRASRRDKQP